MSRRTHRRELGLPVTRHFNRMHKETKRRIIDWGNVWSSLKLYACVATAFLLVIAVIGASIYGTITLIKVIH